MSKNKDNNYGGWVGGWLMVLLGVMVFGTLLLVPAQANGGVIVDSSLVAYYKLDSDASDSSGFGNNGVNHGAVSASDRFGNTTGALSFDGVDNYISVAPSDSLNIAGDLTIAMWIRPQMPSLTLTGPAPGVALVSKRTGLASPQPYLIGLHSDGLLFLEAYYTVPDQWEEVNTPGEVTLDEWQHIAVTRKVVGNEVTVSFYRNGTLLEEVTNQWGAAALNNEEMLIGKDNYYAAWAQQGLFKGPMDDLLIYNRTLSFAEVQTLVPEPTSMGLLALGGLALIRRRRK